MELNNVKTFFNANKQSFNKATRAMLEQAATDHIQTGADLNCEWCPHYLVPDFRRAVKNDEIAHINRGAEMFVFKPGRDMLTGWGNEDWNRTKYIKRR